MMKQPEDEAIEYFLGTTRERELAIEKKVREDDEFAAEFAIVGSLRGALRDLPATGELQHRSRNVWIVLIQWLGGIATVLSLVGYTSTYFYEYPARGRERALQAYEALRKDFDTPLGARQEAFAQLYASRKKLAELNLSYLDLRAFDLRDCDLRFSNLTEAVIDGVNLAGATLEQSTAPRASMEGANLENATLAGSDLSEVRCRKANLHGANLIKCKMAVARLEESDLSNSFLFGAMMERSQLRGAKFIGADMTKTNLAEADLRGVALSGAKLDGTHFEGAIVESADWLEAVQHLENPPFFPHVARWKVVEEKVDGVDVHVIRLRK